MLILHRLYYMIKKGAFQKNKLEDYELLSNMNSNLSLAKVKGTLKVSLSPGWISCAAHVWLGNCWTLQVQPLRQGWSISSPVSRDSAMSSSYQKSLCSQVFCRLLNCNNNNNRKVQKLVI